MKISELKALLQTMDETRNVFINVNFARNLTYIFKDSENDLHFTDSLPENGEILYTDDKYIFGSPKQ